VAREEVEHAVDNARRVDALRLELLHDVEELPQDARAREISSGYRRVRVRDARTRVSITMAPGATWLRRAAHAPSRQGARTQAHTLL
jgi:hypothetical protein